jgi:DNA-directed RNA polymerase subunit M/transcription elongation factor TFIIS
MKRVRCPKCDNYIIFDETRYEAGQSLVFKCNECGKEFGIRIGVSKLKNTQKDENVEMADDRGERSTEEAPCGSIVIIENVFHYKQILPLRMGDNIIGRYQKGNPINTAFETVDPSVDLNHCTLNVSRNKKGGLRYTLSDNNSNTGTFVGDVELQPRERRIIEDGTLFTLGATSIILRTADSEENHSQQD